MKELKVVVTGCGGDIGQSIGKILKQIGFTGYTYGCDIHNNHPGKFIFDDVFLLPLCSNTQYLDALYQKVSDLKVDIIIPTSEPEQKFFLKNKITSVLSAPVIMANPFAQQIGFDKLKTIQFLKKNKLPYPTTFLNSEKHRIPLPVIIKKREGSGSKSVIKIDNEPEYRFYRNTFPDYITQEYIPGEDNEYTCGLYRTKSNDIRTIVFQRKLVGESTGYGEVKKINVIERLLIEIAEKINLVGAINIQLRLAKNKPLVFEINPRFSSTVLFRHMLGFKDVLWSIEETMGHTPSNYIGAKEGMKIFRGTKEYID